ncbi:hypothetical protein CLIB1423_04S04654 [[Candida] railenensis]|uniref:Zn(2)-C6 fungal-type domain-containing protein n=1 Tax=[Candida] railenensis TaxID=45579 RepID=A0A9P0QM24_9ASCO|nr:hypothetical protein CLIB1423_04S04654 [[Candida] railenensis]
MKPFKRSHYSKSGCKECKRRKIKCDEGKPNCWQCDRLKKQCQYPAKGEKVRREGLNRIEKNNWNDKNRIPQQPTPNNPSTSQSSRGTSTVNTPLLNPENGIDTHSNTIGTGNVNDSTHSGQKRTSTSSIMNLLNDNSALSLPEKGQTEYSATQAQGLPSFQPLHPQVHQLPAIPPIPTQASTIANQSFRANEASLPVQQHPSNNDALNLSPLPSLVNEGFSKDDLDLLASDLNNIVNNIMFESKFEIKGVASDFDFGSISSPTYQKTYNITTEGIDNTNNGNPDPNNDATTNSNPNYQRLMASSQPQNSPVSRTYSPVSVGSLNHFSPPIQTNAASVAGYGTYDELDNRTASSIHTIPKSVPLDFIKITKSHEKLYLEEFYNEFASIILPFNGYDKATSTYMNPARDILLTCAARETYLLAAILAQGAKSNFKKSGIQEDEKLYCYYLSKCLQLLGPALGKSKGNDETNNSNSNTDSNSTDLTSNIEAVLLTVLLLTSANASATKQNWRAHLRGAKDLLLKYSFTSSSKHIKQVRRTPILIFCKFWYVSIEVLAGLSSEYGGTLKAEEDLDKLITPGDEYEVFVMKSFKIIRDDGFNILFGYYNDCIVHLRDLIKIINRIRAKPPTGSEPPATAFEYFRLISAFYEESQRTFVDSSGIVNEDRLAHISPGGSLIETFASRSKNRLSVSWVDISHQSYIIGSLVTILTRGFHLSSSSTQVQELVSRFIPFLEFLNFSDPPSIKYSVLMIQWPVSIIGLHCINEDHRFLVMKFFRLSAQIGSGSAAISLRRLHKAWNNKNEADDGSSEDLDIDLMTY